MILLKSNIELKHTFEKLIQTMGVSVEWTGLFAVVGDYLILQGKVRSLFFNFENRKVITNILEIPVKEDEIIEITEATKVQNVINIVLYAFGKWGTISGLKVEKNYAQLNGLFTGVFKEFYINPEYTSENFRFYKESIRITYEDVVLLAIEAGEKLPEEPEEEKESKQGLWHKLIWKKKTAAFPQIETTFAERQKERIGNNFYMVGYQCADCKRNLHMVVFPVGREFRIETGEGAVLLARAYNCDNCNCFYTPRPLKLLAEGDVYHMPFWDDRKAYEDYMELLGQQGDRTSNYNFNEFEADSQRKGGQEPEKKAGLEELFKRADTMPEEEFQQMERMIEEGFYSPKSVEKYEKSLKHHAKKRQVKKEQEARVKETEEKAKRIREQKQERERQKEQSIEKEKQKSGQYDIESELPEEIKPSEHKRLDAEKRAKEFYQAKLGVLDRLSENQRRELKRKIQQDTDLPKEEKGAYLRQVDEAENQRKWELCKERAKNCKGKSYAQIKKCVEEISREELPEEMKAPLLMQLNREKKVQGEQEAAQLLSDMPSHMDLKGFRDFEQRLKEYHEVPPESYEDRIKDERKYAEQQEITNLVRRARKNNREDYHDLYRRLDQGGYKKENAAPYIEKVREKIKQMDQEALDDICKDSAQMSFEEGMEAYHKIEEGMFLPELKTNALEMLGKRLARIKTEECELLVKKLKKTLAGKIKENKRFHFYPARDVLMGEASEEEMSVIDSALTSYAGQRQPFEYPILIIDTSKNESGREGMILTPEHIYYSTFLNAYDVPVNTIARFKSSTGLLNRGITAELKNGNKVKLPYAVENSELLAWSAVLKEFVQYLQEKPDSRNVTYLAKEKHEKICCFRCGYVYKGGNVCPKCGYKSNK